MKTWPELQHGQPETAQYTWGGCLKGYNVLWYNSPARLWEHKKAALWIFGVTTVWKLEQTVCACKMNKLFCCEEKPHSV